jgi:hypothetical protein
MARALAVLLANGDKTEAAKAAGVGVPTVYRWLRDHPPFQKAIDDATRQSLRSFSTVLVRLADKAAGALEDALAPEQQITTRLRAADIVTARLIAIRSLVDLEDRIAQLEQQLADRE